jgi:hypothetical protein
MSKPNDWDHEYQIVVTGKTLEAVRHLARWVLDEANTGRLSQLPVVGDGQNLLPFGIIAACDHVFCWQEDIRRDVPPP